MKIPIIAVVGTNASGKSDLATLISQQIGLPLLSADSRQVYRGFDLCSGKTLGKDLRGVHQYGVDLVDPTSYFTLSDYLTYAREVISTTWRNGTPPVVVGGSSLYVTALLDEYELLGEPPDYVERSHLEQLDQEELWRIMAAVNPSASEVIDPRNRRRVIRAIEIGRAGYDYTSTHRRSPENYECLKIGVTWQPELLKLRVASRLRRRIEQGMIEEVQLARTGHRVSDAFLESLGLEYRHILKLLTGEYATVEELIDQLERAIYRFAKRQLSWFRRDDKIIWLPDSEDREHIAVQMAADWFKIRFARLANAS